MNSGESYVWYASNSRRQNNSVAVGRLNNENVYFGNKKVRLFSDRYGIKVRCGDRLCKDG